MTSEKEEGVEGVGGGWVRGVKVFIVVRHDFHSSSGGNIGIIAGSSSYGMAGNVRTGEKVR